MDGSCPYCGTTFSGKAHMVRHSYGCYKKPSESKNNYMIPEINENNKRNAITKEIHNTIECDIKSPEIKTLMFWSN